MTETAPTLIATTEDGREITIRPEPGTRTYRLPAGRFQTLRWDGNPLLPRGATLIGEGE